MPTIGGKWYSDWSEYSQQKVKNGQLYFCASDFLKDIKVQFEAMEFLASYCEDMSDYMIGIEDAIEYLNIKLIDDTPNHINLVNDFLNKTVEENTKEYADDLKKLTEKVTVLHNRIVKIEKSQEKFEEMYNILNTLKEGIFRQSLPLKLLSEKDEKFFGLTLTEEWREIPKEKFEKIVSSHYTFFSEDIFTHVKTFHRIQFEQHDTLFFDFV